MLCITLLLFAAGSTAAQAASPFTSLRNSALDQYYEQIPLPNGDGPVEPKGPDSRPDQGVVDRMSNRYGDDGSAAATVAHLTDPKLQSRPGSAEDGHPGGKPDDLTNANQPGGGAGVAASGGSVVAASVAPSMSTFGELGGSGLPILFLMLGTAVILAVAVRNRRQHDRSDRQS